MFAGHKQMLSEIDLKCLLMVGGFRVIEVSGLNSRLCPELSRLDNRKSFSLFVEATK